MTAYSVTGYEYREGYDTLKVSALPAGRIVKGGSPIVFNSEVKNPVFVPTALAATITPETTYVNGSYCDSIPTITGRQAANKDLYEFRNGDRGVGFYKKDRTWKVPGGTVYGIFGVNSTYPAAESYVFGRPYNPTPTGISSHLADEQKSGNIPLPKQPPERKGMALNTCTAADDENRAVQDPERALHFR